METGPFRPECNLDSSYNRLRIRKINHEHFSCAPRSPKPASRRILRCRFRYWCLLLRRILYHDWCSSRPLAFYSKQGPALESYSSEFYCSERTFEEVFPSNRGESGHKQDVRDIWGCVLYSQLLQKEKKVKLTKSLFYSRLESKTDIWVYSILTQQWTAVDVPMPLANGRSQIGADIDPVSNTLHLFGGAVGYGKLSFLQCASKRQSKTNATILIRQV